MRQRVIRIHRRDDGRFVTRNEIATDSPLGVDASLNMAMGTAHREATLTARNENCRVIIAVMKASRWTEVGRVEPPS